MPSPYVSKSFSSDKTKDALQLLNGLWRSPDRIHQVSVLDRKTKQFRNIPVKTVAEAVERAGSLSDGGAEVYFACAEYEKLGSRQSANVSGAFAFWMDFDCSEEKASLGKGYRTNDDAVEAIRHFCSGTKIPEPTHIVESGGGIHVYWVLEESIGRELWQAMAAKLKALCSAKGLLADPSRTSDIASVLRVPGTSNHKYEPPRSVLLKHAATPYIPNKSMLDAICNAHSMLPVPPSPSPYTTKKNTNGNADTSSYGPPNLSKLASALAVLDPDCDEATWKLSRIAPMARAACKYPAQTDELYKLCKSWSSGELRGNASKAWNTPGNCNGLTGADAFEKEWSRFLDDKYDGPQTTLGTIYHDATAAGWLDSPALKAKNAEQFTVINEPLDALATIQQQYCLINMDGKVWVFERRSLTARTAHDTAKKLVLSNRSDGNLLITRAIKSQFPGENAKNIVCEFISSPATTCYDGVEFNPRDTSENYLNLWIGPTLSPKAGDWTLIAAFLLLVICNGDQASYRYLLAYIAHALQCPWEKPGILIVLLGGQGTGKGTLGRLFRLIWSATFLQVHNIDAVTGNFNASLERAFIVFMDEALFVGDRRASDALKSLVTEPVIHINEKHQPARQSRSYHRFIAATNADHLKNTERDDRRDFVLRVSESYKGDHAYWDALNQEIENGGVEAMVHDLLAMDLSGFNVRNKPETKELLEQKLRSLDPVGRWWHECLSNGDIDDGEDWPDFIGTKSAIDCIVDTAGGKLFRKPASSDVVKSLQKLCPSAMKKQQQNSLARERGLALPSLEQARLEFELFIGGPMQW